MGSDTMNKIYIPNNENNIKEGSYSLSAICELLKDNMNNSTAIFYIVDQIEEELLSEKDTYKEKVDLKLKELKRSYAWLYYNKLEGQ
tara:strand:+ start:994 stop:1254 length:261 start_codon:yes stop_codon:yes gene_type:complete